MFFTLSHSITPLKAQSHLSAITLALSLRPEKYDNVKSVMLTLSAIR